MTSLLGNTNTTLHNWLYGGHDTFKVGKHGGAESRSWKDRTTVTSGQRQWSAIFDKPHIVCLCVCVFSLNVLFMTRGSWVEAFKPDHSPPLTFHLTPPVITSLRTSSSSSSFPCLLPLKSVWNVNGYSRGKYPTPHTAHTVCSLKCTLLWVPVALFSDVTLKMMNMQVSDACFLA